MQETTRHRFVVSAEIDEKRLRDYHAELDEKAMLDLWPGEPDEWRSLIDITDAIASGIIVRSELIDHYAGPDPYEPEPRGWIARLVASLKEGLAR